MGIRAALPATIRPWFWVGLFILFTAIGVGIFVGFHTRIFQLLESVATVIKKLGYVYGFGLGLFITYTSALLGSIACFYLCRRWFKTQVRSLIAKKQKMKSVVKAVEKRGFKLMLLIRLAPYPFNLMNALLSATHIPLSTFALATAISLTKLTLHVYIGSTLSSLATLPPPTIPTIPGEGGTDPDGSLPVPTDPGNPGNNNSSHGRSLKIVFMVMSMTIGLAVGFYVWTVAKREIAASEGIRIERRRKRRASLRQSLRASMRSVAGLGSGRAPLPQKLLARSGSSGGLVELGQDCVPVIDLTSSSSGSDFVNGAGFSMNGYQDDEEEGLEDQALVGDGIGGSSGDRFSHHHLHSHSLSRSGGSLFVGGAGSVEYGTDSDDSDFSDDDYGDDDVSDMERGIDSDEDDGDEGHDSRSPFLSRSQSGTEMDSIRNPLPRQHAQGSLRTSQDNLGWFAENGVDISDNDRRW
ncbi:Transmembrane protein 64 [Mortierella sp. GBA35]|nr:Transmembrane protein 64 [Mortierella sp. GBA35]